MNRERYLDIVRGFSGQSIVVLGDLMMDEYLWGRATRISPESPVMVVDVERESSVPGGAANVVNNLLTLGARVSVVGVVGDDAAGAALVEALRAEGADTAGVVTDTSRPTTRKTRVVAHNQQVLRVDREQARPVDVSVEGALIARMQSAMRASSGMLVSDYNKGVVTPDVAGAAVAESRRMGALLTANPKPPNVRSLAGAGVITLNQVEAEAAAGCRFEAEAEMAAAGAALRESLQVGTLVVTRGSKGLSLWTADGSAHVPAHPVEVYDVAGAGDTVISALTLSLLAGASPEEAAEVANHAAACVVRKLGVATVTPDELMADWPH